MNVRVCVEFAVLFHFLSSWALLFRAKGSQRCAWPDICPALTVIENKTPPSVHLRVHFQLKAQYKDWILYASTKSRSVFVIRWFNISSQLISPKHRFLLTHLLSLPLGGDILLVMTDTWGWVAVRCRQSEVDTLSLLWLRWWANSLPLYLLTVAPSLQTNSPTT